MPVSPKRRPLSHVALNTERHLSKERLSKENLSKQKLAKEKLSRENLTKSKPAGVAKSRRIPGRTPRKPERAKPKSPLPSTQSGSRFALSDFEIGKTLGKGKLGKVYCVKHKASGLICAIKVMAKRDLVDLKLEKNFRREIEIQSTLVHPHISRLYGFFFDETNVYLILEYAVYGELYQLLKTHRRFDDITASHYIAQVALALEYLHARGIIHRDIKPENILLAADKTVKLSDFGWSVKTEPRRAHKRLTICGTLDYLSPEMVELKEHDFSVDVWLLGVLCYEFLVGRPPFEEIDKNATYKRIANVNFTIPSFVEEDAADLIRKLLQKNPKERISVAEVANHPWILKYKPLWPKPRA